MCEPVDSATAFLPYELIQACEASGLLMTLAGLAEIKEGELYGGWDVARKKHFSVIWLDHKLGDVRYARYILQMANWPFAKQKESLHAVMKLPRLRRLCIDATGMGAPIAEEAIAHYGAYRTEAVTMTGAIKEMLATELYTAIEDRRCRFPADQTLRDSFHSIKKFITAAGNVRFDADATDETGHADHFWAKALAEHAAKSNAGPVTVTSKPGKRQKTDVSRY
jgi:phage FluMu gp28-like protein